MPQKQGQLMTRVKYAEALVGKALALNRAGKKAEKVRAVLLVSALRELQAETGEPIGVSRDQPE